MHNDLVTVEIAWNATMCREGGRTSDVEACMPYSFRTLAVIAVSTVNGSSMGTSIKSYPATHGLP